MTLLDAHCHLKIVAENYDLPAIITEAKAKGITNWFSSALSREEVWWHQQNLSPEMQFCAGIHPLYNEGTPLSLDDLEQLIISKQIIALGEIGLDKRNPDLKSQIALFQDQLSLAKQYELPVVLHVNGHYDILFKIMSNIELRYLWHGFYASKEIVSQFSHFDITFSLGQVLLTSQKHEIVKAIVERENFLIETDAPYHNDPAKYSNPFFQLVFILNSLSKLAGVKPEHLTHLMQRTSKKFIK